jgi:hypothetical protein
METCTKCGIEKDDSCFSKSKIGVRGLKPRCKECSKKDNAQYRLTHPDQSIQYYANNKDKIRKYQQEHTEEYKERQRKRRVAKKEELREKKRAYDAGRKAERNAKLKDRRKNDPSFRIRSIVSRSIHIALKRNGSSKNGKSCNNYLPQTIAKIRTHLESLFEPWMTWNNQGKYDPKTWKDDDQSSWTWQLDHIVPRADLPYVSMEDDNFKKCWNISNLRPYPSKWNVIEGVTKVRHRK